MEMKMNLATVKPSSILFHCSSTVLRNSYRPNSHLPSVKFPARGVRSKGRLSLRVKALDSYKEEEEEEDSESDDDSELPDGISDERRKELLEFMNNLLPDFVKSFIESEPQEVVEEIPETVVLYIKEYPPHYFDSPLGEHFTRSMYVAMVIGYMYWNALTRKELEIAVDDLQGIEKEDLPGNEPLKRYLLTGDSPSENNDSNDSVQIRTDAKKFIDLLEADIKELKRLVSAQTTEEQRELLKYFRTIYPLAFNEDVDVGEDVAAFIQRFPAIAVPILNKLTESEYSDLPVATPLAYLMAAGIKVREKKVAYEMKSILEFAKKDWQSIAKAATDENGSDENGSLKLLDN